MKNFSLKLKVCLFIILLFLITGIILFLINQLDSSIRNYVFKSLVIISIMYILFPFIKVNSNLMVCYFFCFDTEWWDKRVQRPRIFIYIMYFVFLFLISNADNSNVKDYIHYVNNYMLIFYLLLGVVLLGKMVWSEKFENAFLPEIKKMLNNDIALRKMEPNEIQEIIVRNKKNIDENSIDDLKLFLEGKEPRKKIKWVGTSGKRVVTYTDLFFLLHNILEDSEFKFEKSRRKKFLELIVTNFEKFDNQKYNAILYDNVNSSYTNFVYSQN